MGNLGVNNCQTQVVSFCFPIRIVTSLVGLVFTVWHTNTLQLKVHENPNIHIQGKASTEQGILGTMFHDLHGSSRYDFKW